MSVRQRAPEAECRGNALKRTDAPVHLVVEQLDVEHLRFLTWIEPRQLGPGRDYTRSEIVEKGFGGKGDEYACADEEEPAAGRRRDCLVELPTGCLEQ